MKKKSVANGMVEGFAITFVGVLQMLGLVAAFMLGRQTERPRNKWPKGSLMQGGWEAWRIPLIIMASVAIAVTVFLPIVSEMGLGNLFGGFGFGGMYGASRGRRYGGASGGYGGGYGASY